jgi:acetyltransferase-like isoleucine patch superfamily enzyme
MRSRLSFSKKIAFRTYLCFRFADFRTFRAIRRQILRYILNADLKGLVIDGSVRLNGLENLSLGNNVSIHYGGEIHAQGGLSIGDYVAIARNCTIMTTSHTFADKTKPIKLQKVTYHPVQIADNVWVGANVTILGGVTLETGTVVAAGAVVTKSFSQKNIILAGVPARIIKHY